jgi:hypothetical protein
MINQNTPLWTNSEWKALKGVVDIQRGTIQESKLSCELLSAFVYLVRFANTFYLSIFLAKCLWQFE